MRTLIVSPVGTSLLTNGDGDKYKFLGQTANFQEADFSQEQKTEIDQIISDRKTELTNTDKYEDYKRMSAELNGIFSYCVPDKDDFHLLIATDTYQCKEVANIIEMKLRSYGAGVEIPDIKELSTKSKADFEKGIDNLIKALDDRIDGYRQQGFRIVFNLTGGFKAVIGYLNLLGMFYADEIFYIFERTDELIRIPRMPIKIDEEKLGDTNALMAMLDQPAYNLMDINKLNQSGIQTNNLYESLFEIDEDSISLSIYGKLIWNGLKKDKYKELIQFPLLEYKDDFKKSFRNNESHQDFQKLTNEKLALLSAYLIENDFNMATLGSKKNPFSYENLNGGLGHFRISGHPNQYRAICTPKKAKMIMIDCGLHDLNDEYENKKPEQII